MCGIAGIFNLDGRPVAQTHLRRMTDAIAHRGPDGEGFFADSFIGMGHRRLSILDLSPSGHQPMMEASGRFIIVYNGEVYNFQELRIELEAKGHRFRSRTDTEVVLGAYAEWGADCLNRFNGMFAFAIWDKRDNELFLARDRYGIKPLYYSFQGNTFYFGSEVKALWAHPECHREVDKEGLMEYFTFQNFFSDKTLFEGIHLLPPASYVKIPLAAQKMPPIRQYWDFDFTEPETVTDEREYVEELDRLLQQAVNRQLVSDVDVGGYLSGGMDSGSLVGLASRQVSNMRTFTCGFDLSSASGLELAFDERAKAEAMSYEFQTEHYEMVLKAGDMERCLPNLAWHLEEPRVGQSYPNYYISKLAGKFNKVVLSGAGGDEIFAGYPWRYYRAVVNQDFDDYIHKYYQFWQRLVPNRQLHEVFKPVWPQVEHVWTEDIFRNVFQAHASELTRPEDYVNHSLYFEAKTFLHGLLVMEDKLNMAHGVEVRVPFLDNDLVDFAMKIPAHLKLGNLKEVVRLDENEPGDKLKKYFQKTRDGKLILRQVMNRHLPEQVTREIKQGFSAPDSSWFRGESIDYVKRVIFNKNARMYDYMDPDAVQGLVREHLSGDANRRLFVWSLLNVEEFLDQYMSADN